MVFMIGVVLALVINYPDLNSQRDRIDSHAQASLMMASILLAAGAFTGIMKESGMLAAMAQEPPATCRLEWACTFRWAGAGVDAAEPPVRSGFFYFGVLPVVAEVANGRAAHPGGPGGPRSAR